MIIEQVGNMLEMYNNPLEVTKLVEGLDYHGRNVWYYLDEYNLYKILDSRILDRLIQEKWSGKYDINSSLSEYSTGFVLLRNSSGLFTSDLVMQEIYYEMFTLNRQERVHNFKFQVWQASMWLRSVIEIGFQFIVCIWFQFELIDFNTSLRDAIKVARHMETIEEGTKPWAIDI